jgi:hypothetical protein
VAKLAKSSSLAITKVEEEVNVPFDPETDVAGRLIVPSYSSEEKYETSD